MNADERYDDESPAGLLALVRRFRWPLVAVGVVVLGVLATLIISNPGEKAHRAATGGQTHCSYQNYLFFSTMTRMELSGEQRKLSTGFLGKVTLTDAAAER